MEVGDITEGEWRVPTSALPLPSGEVHLWRTRLDLAQPGFDRLSNTLSTEERARAERFVADRDRRRFVAARGTLRLILARYVDLGPDEFRFNYGARGKPGLPDASLRFNLSHSDGLALYAMTLDREVGVDVERVRPIFDLDLLAREVMSDSEWRAWQALPLPRRAEAFFALWTRKEAYLKARGDGLSLPLDGIAVPLEPGAIALARTAHDPADAVHWSVFGLVPAPGFVAAVVAAGDGFTLRHWQTPDPSSL